MYTVQFKPVIFKCIKQIINQKLISAFSLWDDKIQAITKSALKVNEMKPSQKLTKKTIDRHKPLEFTKPNHANTVQNHIGNSPIMTGHSKQQRQPNRVKTQIELKQPPQSSATNEFKKILKQSQALRKIKSEERFQNYKSLITNYQQQQQTSQHKQHQESLKHLIQKKYQQMASASNYQNLDSKPIQTKKLQARQQPISSQNSRPLEQSHHNNYLALKQKQLQIKYLLLQQKYKEILIVTKDQTKTYEQNKNKLLALKTQHFQDQNLLQSLRSHYFSQNNHQNPPKIIQNHLQMISCSVQTENNYHSQVQQQQNYSNLSHQTNENDQKYKKKYKTELNWFKSSKNETNQQIKIPYQGNQQQKDINQSKSIKSQSKRHSTYSEKYLKSSLLDKQKFNNLQEEVQAKKSNISLKREKTSFLSSSSLKKNYKNLKNEQLSVQKLRLKQADDENEKERETSTPRLNKYVFEDKLMPSKNDNISIKKSATEVKKIISELKGENLKGSRLSSSSVKSVKRNLFGTSKYNIMEKEKGFEKSDYLQQFRKQAKKEINTKKHEQFMSDNQHKETFGTREKFEMNDGIVPAKNLAKSRRKEKPKQIQQQEPEEKQVNIGPETPIYKFYQSRKPISPSSALSKYRFKPSIKIP